MTDFKEAEKALEKMISKTCLTSHIGIDIHFTGEELAALKAALFCLRREQKLKKQLGGVCESLEMLNRDNDPEKSGIRTALDDIIADLKEVFVYLKTLDGGC